MFIEIESCCINISNIIYFKKFQDKWEGQLCVIYTNCSPEGMSFKDKDGKLYNSLKKICNICNVLYPNIIEQPDDGKVRW